MTLDSERDWLSKVSKWEKENELRNGTGLLRNLLGLFLKERKEGKGISTG